jgi:hypothetical protein
MNILERIIFYRCSQVIKTGEVPTEIPLTRDEKEELRNWIKANHLDMLAKEEISFEEKILGMKIV